MYNISFELVVLSFIALGLIHIFYYLFKLSWPEMYFSVSDSTSLFISFSPIRYIAFRIIPIFTIISLILGISAVNNFKMRIYAGLMIGIVHTYITNFNAFKKVFTGDKTIHIYLNKSFQIFIHLATIAVIVIISVVAGALSSWEKIQLVSPSMSGLVDNLWSSVIAAMLGVWIYKLYQRTDINSNDLFDKYLQKINPEILAKIKEESKNKKANVDIVKAICMVENIQRPRWIRRIEKIKSMVNKKGTYGIMQTGSDHYITDDESISIAVEKYFCNTDDLKWKGLKEKVYKYNNDERYNEFIENAYRHLSQEPYEYEDEQNC